MRINICLVRENAAELETMLALVDEVGASCGIDHMMSARYDGTRSSLDHRLDRDTLDSLYRGPLERSGE